LNATVVEYGVTMTGDLAGKLECLTNQFAAQIQNGSYTFNLFPLPNPFAGDLSGTLDSLTSTMSGQWNLMGQAPPGFTGPSCTGPWRDSAAVGSRKLAADVNTWPLGNLSAAQ
jgi:hypothetical protein